MATPTKLAMGATIWSTLNSMPPNHAWSQQELKQVIKEAKKRMVMPDDEVLEKGLKSVPIELVAAILAYCSSSPTSVTEWVSASQLRTLNEMLTSAQGAMKRSLRTPKVQERLKAALDKHRVEF
jgi:hypothetical protein